MLLCAAGAPERLCVLMEGESLFNDSSSIVLFKIFFDMVKRLAQGKPGSQLGMGAEALDIAGNIVWLTVGASCPFCPLHQTCLCLWVYN